MARGTQLLELVTMLRDELGRSSNVAVGVDDLPNLKQVLNRTYESLYDEYDWPHLQQEFPKITLQAGQRYYDQPIGMNPDRVDDHEGVVVWYSGLPHPLERGITFDDYASYDSTTDVRTEPALKWDIRFTGVTEQIEIWPIPSSNEQLLQIRGYIKHVPLVSDADQCRLDDHAVVLFAAADLEQDEKEARKKLAAARDRLSRVKTRSKSGTRTYRMGMGVPDPRERSRAIVRVR